MKIPSPEDFAWAFATVKVGSKVQALRNVWFTDGSRNIKGEVINVTEENLAFFRLFTDNKKNYKLLQENTKPIQS
jgi:hypothetical protein